MSADHLDDLDDEIREHLERDTQEEIERGLSPADARQAARRKFGNVALVKENARAVYVPVWIDQLRQDLGYALRMLRRGPAFTVVVTLTLALGIGLNTAVFSVVNAVLLRPLSFPHADRVLSLAMLDAQGKDELVPSQDVLAWRDATSIERLVGYDQYDGRVIVGGMNTPARIATVSHDFWDLAGAQPALGRVPAEGESEVLLSHAFSEKWFGGVSDVVGTRIVVAGRPATIAGVLPPSFRTDLAAPPSFAGLGPRDVEIYRAIVVRPLTNGQIQLFSVLAQMKPGVSLDAARAELSAIHTRVEAENPAFPRQTLHIVPLMEKLVGDARRGLLILLAAVAAMLLVGCANIASLLLARASARQRELAIRAAIGAGRGRMLRQLLVESLLLALAGAAAGLLVAHAGLRVMLRLIPQAVPRLSDASLDGRVLLFALAASLVTALLFGIGPALLLLKTDARDVLRDGARQRSVAPGGVRARKWLVTVELALTLVLLCGAGLLVKSLWRLTAYPSGFAPAQTLTMTVEYDGGNSPATEARRREYVSEVLRRIRPVAGVEAVGMTTNSSGRLRVIIEDTPGLRLQDRPAVLHSSVSEGYARAIGMRLTKGRWLTDTEPTAAFVLNESAARRLFSDQDPIGKRIQIGGPPGASAAQGATFATIVGVVADLKYARLDTPPEAELFEDYQHASPFSITIVARVADDPQAAAPLIRSLVAGVDTAQRVSNVRTIEQVLIESIAPRRFTVMLLGTFAAAALLLALIGVYGVMAYSVALRTREIGVRMALGAQRHDVMWTIVAEGISIAIVGLAIGGMAALATTRVMSSLLYQVAPNDPATFAAVAGALGATVVGTCCSAAFKAARVDPSVALRYE